MDRLDSHIRPAEIQRDGQRHFVIVWSDGQRRRYEFQEILDNCPCASCREKRTGAQAKQDDSLLPIIKPEEAQPLQLVSIEPVGAYAYSIHFNYGCRKGIFTFEHLRQLGEEVT
jgi:DUF971 family protein